MIIRVPMHDESTGSNEHSASAPTVLRALPDAPAIVTRTRPRTRGIALWSPWVIGLAVLAVSVYAFGRLTYVSANPLSYVRVGPDGEIKEGLPFDRPFRVLSVGSTPVESAEDFVQVARNSDEPVELELTAEQPEGVVRALWVRRPTPPDLNLSSTGFLGSFARLTPEEWGVTQAGAVLSINGHALGPSQSVPELLQDRHQGHIVIELRPGPDDRGIKLFVLLSNFQVAWALWGVGLAFGAIGTTTIFLQRRDPAAIAFAAFCLNVTLFWGLRAIPGAYRFPMENFAYFLGLAVLPSSTFAVVATFTPVSLLLDSPHRRFRTVVVSAICLLVAGGVVSQYLQIENSGPLHLALLVTGISFVPVVYVIQSIVLRGANSVFSHCVFALAYSSAIFLIGLSMYFETIVRDGALNYAFWLPWLIVMLVLMVAAQMGDWLCSLLRVEVGPVFKQRGRIVRLASIMGFGPTMVYTFYLVSTHQYPTEIRLLFEGMVIFFPLLIAYAIVRQNFLRVDEVVLQALAVAVVSLLWLGGYLGIVVYVDRGLSDFLSDYAVYMRGGLIALLTATTIPAYSIVRTRVRQMFSRTAGSVEDIERILDDILAQHSSIGDYWRHASKILSGRMLASSATLLLPERVQTDGINDTNRSGDTVSLARKLLQYLETADAHRRSDEVEPVLDALDAELEIPLRAHGALVGAILFGPEAAGRPYAAADINVARRLASRMALHVNSYSEASLSGGGKRIIDVFPRIPGAIGRYRVLELVGEGGMSHVFLAEEDGRKVAIKVPNRRVQNDDTLMLRFLRESSVLLRLQHPNIVDVIEIATLGREPYIVMEYFAEGSLRTQLRRRGRFTTEEAVSILIQAVRGLAAALDKGVLHRDVKPHNLFMAADGILKVGDFGLAEIADEDSLTDPGQLLGTRAYLAPEVVANGAHSHLSDQYSLGVSTYELLTGSRPYIPEREVSNGRFRSALLDVGADPRLTDCVGKMTSADPLARFDSYATLENALTQLLPTEA